MTEDVMTENAGRVRNLFRHRVDHVPLPADEVRAHLADVAAPMLLLCAVHVTGDSALLDKYAHRVGRFEGPAQMLAVADEASEGTADSSKEAAPDPSARAELVELLIDELSAPERGPYAAFTDDSETFQWMSQIATGAAFNEAHLGLNQEQAGFVAEQLYVSGAADGPEWLSLVIVGAGMGGLDAAVKAADRGISFEVFEKEGGIGGLWWTQRYPGVAVDTPTTNYSLSWEVTPEWSRYYPNGSEYRSYLDGIADKYGIREKVSLNSEVIRMEWLEDEHVWELTVRSTIDGSIRKVRAATVLTAAGNLCRPSYPKVEGIDTFGGESIHSARWRDDVDLTGKRVGVVGVGAAGVQIVSEVAQVADQLTVFQRQAHWVLPNNVGDGSVSDHERWLRRYLPYYKNWQRLAGFAGLNFASWLMNQWDEAWVAEHPESANAVNAAMREQCLAYINETFADRPDLAAKLTPDFPFGAKRPVRDPRDFEPGGYYWAYAQPHVNLVTSSISKVVPEGLVTVDGDIVELDVIIWCTGMTLDNLVTVDVLGRGGRQLRDDWADDSPWEGPRAYLGGTVPGFPNLFITDGPNTGVALGGGSHNYIAETMNHYILECIQMLRTSGARSIEVTLDAFNAYQEEIDRRQAKLMWANESKAHTYYRNKSGRAFFTQAFEVSEFWGLNRQPIAEAFQFASPGDQQ
ncbi:flavin-containing monooxygenase [Arthrobacter bambusae]|jgi:cation diffusion facilitator CzcD-associated flavoprotein CzcO|uniref:flavin-containing monooxygenase n=1 Tax=Arthrobacter bambusae TaxID=1338426 RepID=UPI0027854500|nr:NAD(P)/FAD-dependent oxidoreductase [Arthrobacter bambusae]MDQ0241484.1 cation diffusion facilitator CzcD-associated flavoprotein CzcO [Arthrobacter bambusae]